MQVHFFWGGDSRLNTLLWSFRSRRKDTAYETQHYDHPSPPPPPQVKTKELRAASYLSFLMPIPRSTTASMSLSISER